MGGSVETASRHAESAEIGSRHTGHSNYTTELTITCRGKGEDIPTLVAVEEVVPQV